MLLLKLQLERMYYIFDPLSSDSTFYSPIIKELGYRRGSTNCSHSYIVHSQFCWNSLV
jgi:hypothetical protein